MEWQLDNPATALKEYYYNYDSFGEKKRANEVLKNELASQKGELKSKKSEFDEVRQKLQEMNGHVEADPDSQIDTIKEQAEIKIANAQKEFESQKDSLTVQKEKDLKENDAWLAQRLQQLLGDNPDMDVELTDVEKKALEFEMDRRQFIIASNERINKHQDGITQEKLECRSAVGEWKKEQDGITSEFAPDIDKYKQIINSIKQKYQPDIRQYQNTVSEKVAARDEEIGQLQSELNREIQIGKDEITGYQQEFKQTEKQYNDQIRLAKMQNKPTTRMENSKMTRLNNINDQIQKINNRVNRKTASIEQKISDAKNKHDHQISKAEEKLNAVIAKRDYELKEPMATYNGLVSDRDGRINAIEARIQQRESACDARIQELTGNINAERSLQEKHHQDVDGQIVTFVMNGDTCLSDVMNEIYAPFMALQDKLNSWMELLHTIKKDKMVSAYSVEHEKQKSMLVSQNYQELMKELLLAQQFNGMLSIFAKNNGGLKIVGAILGGISIIVAVLAILLFSNFGIAGLGILFAALGVAIIVLTVIKEKQEFSTICRYVSLATDYTEFPEIAAHSTQVTQERELAKMKNMGNKLYDVHYGKTEAQGIHGAKDADIRSDYENALQLMASEMQAAIEEAERERDRKINNIEQDILDERVRFTNEMDEVQNTVQLLSQKISAIETRIKKIQMEMEENGKFIDAFESNYRVLESRLSDSKWIAPMEYTHGKLSDELFVIPEKGAADEYGHKRIYCITHNKKPVVITYDISSIGDGDASQVEETGKIICNLMYDLMYSVYRMNSKESYAQYVVDEVGGTNELKSSTVKNAFNIAEVAGKVDDVRNRLKTFAAQRERLAEKGTCMDDINERKFREQERPEVYNILYMIYKPNERRSRLEEDMSRLIPDCDKYGFLPVFICENETWNRETAEKDSMYKEIKSFLNNPVVSFDGTQYLNVV